MEQHVDGAPVGVPAAMTPAAIAAEPPAENAETTADDPVHLTGPANGPLSEPASASVSVPQPDLKPVPLLDLEPMTLSASASVPRAELEPVSVSASAPMSASASEPSSASESASASAPVNVPASAPMPEPLLPAASASTSVPASVPMPQPLLAGPVSESSPTPPEPASISMATAAAPVAGPRSWRHRGQVEDATTQLSWNRGCVFCGIVADKKVAAVVYEDERFLAFKDISPSGNPHYQVIPKHHLRDINALRPDAHDIEMVEAMIAIGTMLMARDHPKPNGAYRLAFHRPPLISVPHLHMHTIGLPLRGFGLLKHGAIFGWSADAAQVLADLRQRARSYPA